MANHYKTLRVKKKATQKEIKVSYRDLAREFHPDKNQGDKESEEEFKKISNAYEVLSDPVRRAEYDRTGSDTTDLELHRKAEGLLQQIFQLVVSQKSLAMIQKTDMIKAVSDQLDLGMSELQKNIDTSRKSRNMIGKILKRVKHKNKMNPVSVMLRHEIEKHSETIAKSKLEMKVGKLAIKMWKEYGFDYEQEVRVNYRVGYGLSLGSQTVNFTGAM
jgi:curved DNA-binding protein CbpA